MSIEITPDAYLTGEGEVDTSLSYEQREQKSHRQAATNYARRAGNTYEPSSDDIALHGVLAKIERETNPLIREQLEHQAQVLAAGGVITERKRGRRQTMKQVQTYDPTEIDGEESVMTTPYGQLQTQYGRETLDTVLNYCRDNLDPEAIELLNERLTSDDIKVVKTAFNIARHMEQNKLRNFK